MLRPSRTSDWRFKQGKSFWSQRPLTEGSENVQDVLQTIGVFPDDRCVDVPIVLRDDLAYSGVEETFGTVVTSTDNPGLYNRIVAAASWPVEVDFVDIDGNKTAGRVRARIIR